MTEPSIPTPGTRGVPPWLRLALSILLVPAAWWFLARTAGAFDEPLAAGRFATWVGYGGQLAGAVGWAILVGALLMLVGTVATARRAPLLLADLRALLAAPILWILASWLGSNGLDPPYTLYASSILARLSAALLLSAALVHGGELAIRAALARTRGERPRRVD